MALSGRVIEEQKNYFVVATAEGRIGASIQGKLRKIKARVYTGDMVDLDIIDRELAQGVITHIHPRTTFIKRPALANCSHLLCVCTFKEPPLSLESLDRLLFSASVYGLQTSVIFNKIDTLSPAELDALEKITNAYTSAGFPTFAISARTKEGVDRVITFCQDKFSACAGLSGVGKSTFLAAVFPELTFRTGTVSGTSGRGTHTTTTVTLLTLPTGGYIADTPGYAFIDLPKIPEEEVVNHFPEFERIIGTCQFNNCIHDGEPGCIVTAAIEAGSIAPWRHHHYLKTYREMREMRKKY